MTHVTVTQSYTRETYNNDNFACVINCVYVSLILCLLCMSGMCNVSLCVIVCVIVLFGVCLCVSVCVLLLVSLCLSLCRCVLVCNIVCFSKFVYQSVRMCLCARLCA